VKITAALYSRGCCRTDTSRGSSGCWRTNTPKGSTGCYRTGMHSQGRKAAQVAIECACLLSKGKKAAQAAVRQARPEAARQCTCCCRTDMYQGSTGCCRNDTIKGCTSLYFCLLCFFRFLFPSFRLFWFVSLPLVLFCFASDFNVSLICESKRKKLFFFRFEAKKVLLLFRLENEN
jgi:hypothetical protein